MNILLCYHSGLAVAKKISTHTAKIAEFENLADKSDDDHTAIGHLTTFTNHLHDVSELLTATRRNVESKKNIIIL